MEEVILMTINQTGIFGGKIYSKLWPELMPFLDLRFHKFSMFAKKKKKKKNAAH